MLLGNYIDKPGPLLNPDGTLANPGWATKPLLQYHRRRIGAPRCRIKEWDYYCVLNESGGAGFTIADNGYLGFVSVTVFDFRTPEECTKTFMTAFPLGSFGMPASSEEGDVVFRRKGCSLRFIKEAGYRTIEVEIPAFCGQGGQGNLSGTIRLAQPETMDSMVIATPFPGNRHAFYYNQKINCMPAEGALQFGDRHISFDPATCFGVLDWGRGVWTYSNTWYWGSASGQIGGFPFGFNVGYGFGDTTAATENMLFYRGRAHKLDRVTFHIPEPDFLAPWKFSGNDRRFEMDFVPILDRFSDTNLLVLRSWQHQVFGRFSGRAVLDDGTELEIRDFLGFAEKVINRW